MKPQKICIIYNLISNPRKHKSGGGVGLFISNSFDFKIRSDLESKNPKIYESVFTEIIQQNNKNIILGCLYKPPDVDVDSFLDELK